MSFSVVIPVYNEEKIIESNTKKLIKFLNRLKTRYEIIIADNGSDDKTAEIAKMLEKKYPRVKLISVAKKGAVGWAFRNAVLSARYENIIS
ncbi:MAG: glycosyltransferase, partial [Candidatus Aenigmarchaeota archaeon]|nr:glycosyltransferase [Candidatus Aenigmarchaeota archaeon]